MWVSGNKIGTDCISWPVCDSKPSIKLSCTCSARMIYKFHK